MSSTQRANSGRGGTLIGMVKFIRDVQDLNVWPGQRERLGQIQIYFKFPVSGN